MTPRTTRTLPDGLPGLAAAVDGEIVDAVDGDNGQFYIRYGKRAWQKAVRQVWRFHPATFRECGWWCFTGADHLLCSSCLADRELAAMFQQPEVTE